MFPNEKNLEHAAIRPFYAPGCKPDPDIVELIGLGFQHVTFDIDINGLPTLTKAQLTNFSAPTMVIYGEKDIFFNAEKAMECAKAIIPNLVKTEIIAGQGHIMGQEAHAQVYNKIADFLNNS